MSMLPPIISPKKSIGTLLEGALYINLETWGPQGMMQYLCPGFYPVYAPIEIFANWRGKIEPSLWPKVVEQSNAQNLRSMAKEYGVS
jgi:hypothetical protein